VGISNTKFLLVFFLVWSLMVVSSPSSPIWWVGAIGSFSIAMVGCLLLLRSMYAEGKSRDSGDRPE
jgi:hypothetical protein